MRDEDDEAARQRDLRRQARALRLHRILDRLHEDRLAAADQVLDLACRARLALELGRDDLVDVEEAVLLEADLDERGLHAGQDVVDRAEIDVAGDRAALGPLEVDLGDRSSSSTATRCSPTSTETSSSRFASGSGARRGGSRRRRCCGRSRSRLCRCGLAVRSRPRRALRLRGLGLRLRRVGLALGVAVFLAGCARHGYRGVVSASVLLVSRAVAAGSVLTG